MSQLSIKTIRLEITFFNGTFEKGFVDIGIDIGIPHLWHTSRLIDATEYQLFKQYVEKHCELVFHEEDINEETNQLFSNTDWKVE